MAQSKRSPELEGLLTLVVAGSGLELDSVVLAQQSTTPVVRVFVDAPLGGNGVDSDTLAMVSRLVSTALDEADPIESEYLLEVSTPGAERELSEPRHWLRQIGRRAQVKMRDGSTFLGTVIAADDESVMLNVDGAETTIQYESIKKARARVEFGSKE